MPWTLTTTAPDGTATVADPVTYAAQAAMAVVNILKAAAPWLTERERKSAGLQVARNSGRTWVHTATGYHFRVDTEES